MSLAPINAERKRPSIWINNLALAVVLVLLLTQVAVYFYWFKVELGLPLSQAPESWGQFGDYIGGVLNPVVALAAFVWLMRSVRIQEAELVETRRVLADSSRTQVAQLHVMQRDQQIAVHNSLLSARTAMLQEAGRIHNFFLAQNRQDKNYYDVSGKALTSSDFITLLNVSSKTVRLATEEHAAAAQSLEKLISDQGRV